MSISTAEIKKLIKQGSSEQIALLQSDINPESIVDTLMAMANCSGGEILIGVENESVVGVVDADKACSQIIDIALSLNPPLIISVPTIIKISGKSLIFVEVPKGLPYVYSHQGSYLKRTDKQNTPIHPNDLRQLMIKRGEFSFEAEIAHNSTMDDLDWTQAEKYTKNLAGLSMYTTQDILYQRGCLAKHKNTFIPTHAGILLFGKTPQQFIRSSEITAVRFAGNNMSDTFIKHDITGTLPEQIRQAETFLADHLHKSIHLKDKMQRSEDYEYPMEAVRELIVNAVAHRDYSIAGDNNRIFMYSDHMEVHSPGPLPGPMTVENLKEERFSRNPIIVQVLSDMGFIERLGYGVDRVIELMRSRGHDIPSFINSISGFKVTLSKPIKSSDVTSQSRGQADSEFIYFNGTYAGQAINQRQESALVYLHNKSHSRITNSDLKSMFPDVHPETIRRDLVDLVSKAILKKMGQKRGSYYVLNDQTLLNEP